MRNGPTLAALSDGLSIGARIDIIRGGEVLKTGIPASEVKVEWSSSNRQVPGALSYSCPMSWVPEWPLDALNNFGQRSMVTALYENRRGDYWEIPLGEFVNMEWSVSKEKVNVSCKDLTQILADNPRPWPSSPAAGATLLSEANELAEYVRVKLEDDVWDAPIPRTTQWGNSRIESIYKLVESRGCGIRSGADGMLHIFKLRDKTAPDEIYTYESGFLLEAPRAPRSGGRRPNRWYVTGSKQQRAQGEQEERWTAEREITDPPYDPAGYGWVTSHKEFSAASSAREVSEAADTYMIQDISSRSSRSLTIIPDARIEVGDIVGAITEQGEHIAGRVTAYSLPLSDPSATMRVDIEVLGE